MSKWQLCERDASCPYGLSALFAIHYTRMKMTSSSLLLLITLSFLNLNEFFYICSEYSEVLFSQILYIFIDIGIRNAIKYIILILNIYFVHLICR